MMRIILAFVVILAIQLTVAQSQEVERLVPEVLNVYAHDANAFTQGLLWHDGYLYESTGLYGESTLRQVDLESGERRCNHTQLTSLTSPKGWNSGGRQTDSINLASGFGFHLRCRQLGSD